MIQRELQVNAISFTIDNPQNLLHMNPIFAPYHAKHFFISATLQEKLKLEQSDVFYSLVPQWQIQQVSPKNHSRVSGRSQAIQEVY
jgi:hypothetical protein